MIIQTRAGQLFRVTEPKHQDLRHCYLGTEVKFVKGEYVPKAKAREILINKMSIGSVVSVDA